MSERAENSEPEEPVLYQNSAPRQKIDLPALDILDIDISGTDLKNL
jgi:hypothetical protein